MRNRIAYFEFLRGVAIIMVVGIHTLPNINGFDNISGTVMILGRQFLNCAVPIFLAISGYFIAKKDLAARQNHISFLKKQLPKVYIPCFIFSLGWFLYYLVSHGSTRVFSGVVLLFICGFSVYYFIALIIQLYAITPWLLGINNKGGGNLFGFSIGSFDNYCDIYDAD